MRRSLPTFLQAAILLIAISVLCPAWSGAEENDSLVKVAPAYVDSLVWGNPEINRFIHETLRSTTICGKTDLDFGVFTFACSGELDLHGKFASPNSFFGAPGPTDSGWFYSPDSNWAAYMLRYSGEPDVDLELFDRDSGKIAQLEFCGTPCQFLAVRWLDNDRFVFVKTYEHVEDRGMRPSIQGYQALVTLYDLAADSGHTFNSELILRNPSVHVDSLTSVIWNNPEVTEFINDEIANVSFPGFDRFENLHFSFRDSTELETEECGTLSATEDTLELVANSWILSPTHERAARIHCVGQDECDLRILNVIWRTMVRIDHCEAICRYVALRWLDDARLLVVRLDEDSHFSQRLERKVVDSYTAVLYLYDFDRRHILTHSDVVFFY